MNWSWNRTGKRMACWSTGLVAVIALAGLGTARASDVDEKAVREANAQFYSALNAMFTGQADPMKNVWSHSPNVTYMGPGGEFDLGWTQVEASWVRQAAMKLGGTVNPEDMRFTVGREIAIVSAYEKGENTDAQGQPAKVSIRTTNLFRKEDGAWKMIGHHTDLLPLLAK